MAKDYKTPGVYVEEISKFPPSVAAVETAIPTFIGYTEKARKRDDDDLRRVPHRISSMVEYEQFFGAAEFETGIKVRVNTDPITGLPLEVVPSLATPSKFKMYYSLQFYFANGGGPCYIVSVGSLAAGNIDVNDLINGLNDSGKVDEITLIVFPEATSLSNEANYYSLYNKALDQCQKLQDRFVIMDVYKADDTGIDGIAILRDKVDSDIEKVKYGAAYYPNLETILDYLFLDADVTVTLDGVDKKLSDMKNTQNALYFQVKGAIQDMPLVMTPSSGIAGVYADVDSNRGVWKAPANVNMDYVIKPTRVVSDEEQKSMNVDVVSGKSVNVIRSFTGRGPAIVWGARTLAGNDNEWRYVPVRRFCNMVEESVKKACSQFVFEPNDANTWVRVRAMVENFLILQWRAGALQGAKPEHAFYVHVGLNDTMTAIDILEGRMIVEIGLAVVRPAEFIILRFSQMMPQS